MSGREIRLFGLIPSRCPERRARRVPRPRRGRPCLRPAPKPETRSGCGPGRRSRRGPPDVSTRSGAVFGQPVDRVLRRHVSRRVGHPHRADRRGNLEDLAATSRLHGDDRPAGQVHQGDEVDLDDPPDGGEILVGEVGVIPQARVVDQQVDPAELPLGPVPGLRSKSGIPEVAIDTGSTLPEDPAATPRAGRASAQLPIRSSLGRGPGDGDFASQS